MSQIIPLAPEPIQNTDGTAKQDCEINAAKRAIKKIRKAHPKLKIIVVGDGLFSKQPFIDELEALSMSFLLVSKPADHKIMFEMIEAREKTGKVYEMETVDAKKNLHRYRWTNGVKLNGKKDSRKVNYFEYELFNANLDKVTYRNSTNVCTQTWGFSWVTDIIVCSENVETLVRGGRARWKIENETFNTLKNQGYHIEHNFGHGKKYLSNNFFSLNLIAFFIHQILELTDTLYQKCRKKIGTRLEFFNYMRAFMTMQIYKDWSQFLFYVYAPPKAREYYQHI